MVITYFVNKRQKLLVSANLFKICLKMVIKIKKSNCIGFWKFCLLGFWFSCFLFTLESFRILKFSLLFVWKFRNVFFLFVREFQNFCCFVFGILKCFFFVCLRIKVFFICLKVSIFLFLILWKFSNVISYLIGNLKMYFCLLESSKMFSFAWLSVSKYILLLFRKFFSIFGFMRVLYYRIYLWFTNVLCYFVD